MKTKQFKQFLLGVALIIGGYANAQCPTTVTAAADNFFSTHHAGGYSNGTNWYGWGQNMPSGRTQIAGSNWGLGSNTALKVSGGSNGDNVDQIVILASDNKIYGVGASAVISTASIGLPTNPSSITAASVTNFTASYQTMALVSGGKGYVYQNGVTANSWGDGSTSTTSGWGTPVKSAAAGNPVITDFVQIRCDVPDGTGARSFIGLTSTGKVYVWGTNIAVPGNVALTTANYATEITLPAITGQVVLVGVNISSSASGTSYYIMTNTKELWSIGDNSLKQLGTFSAATSSTNWERVRKSNTAGDYAKVVFFSTSDHDASGDNKASVLMMLDDGSVYGFGSNDYGPLGIGVTANASYDPTIALTGGSSVNGSATGRTAKFITSGGHVSYIIKADGSVCMAGHEVGGSFFGTSNPTGNYDQFDNCTTPTAAQKPCLLPLYDISGKVFVDITADGVINGTGSSLGGAFIALVDANGKVMDTVRVAADGSYKLPSIAGGNNYTLVMTATKPAIGSTLTTATYPTGYKSLGEGTGTAPDANNDGVVSIGNLSANSTANFSVGTTTQADANAGVTGQAISGNVKTNDVLPAGATYGTPINISSPAGSTPTLTFNTTTGAYTLPAQTKPGTYTYSIPVTANGATTYTPLTITVADPNATNNQTASAPDYAVVNSGGSVPIDVLANDKALNSNTGIVLSSTLIAGPTHGTAVPDPATGKVTYTPTPGFVGVDSFSYQVCQPGPVNCKTEKSYITVNTAGTNSVMASDDQLLIKSGSTTAVTGNVLTNDYLTGTGAKTVSLSGGTTITAAGTVLTQPGGTLTLKSDGSYSFAPTAGFTGTTSFPYTMTNGATSSSATLTFVSSNIIPLPVVFGDVSAIISNGNIVINWATLTEINFDHFLVEISKDGVNWKVLDNVKSKAVDGNSNQELKYSITKSVADTVSLFGLAVHPLALLLLVLFALPFIISFNKNFRHTRTIFAVLFAISLMGTVASCKKNNDTVSADAKSKVFVKITTVDKDGKLGSSNIIQAVQQ